MLRDTVDGWYCTLGRQIFVSKWKIWDCVPLNKLCRFIFYIWKQVNSFSDKPHLSVKVSKNWKQDRTLFIKPSKCFFFHFIYRIANSSSKWNWSDSAAYAQSLIVLKLKKQTDLIFLSSLLYLKEAHTSLTAVWEVRLCVIGNELASLVDRVRENALKVLTPVRNEWQILTSAINI